MAIVADVRALGRNVNLSTLTKANLLKSQRITKAINEGQVLRQKKAQALQAREQSRTQENAQIKNAGSLLERVTSELSDSKELDPTKLSRLESQIDRLIESRDKLPDGLKKALKHMKFLLHKRQRGETAHAAGIEAGAEEGLGQVQTRQQTSEILRIKTPTALLGTAGRGKNAREGITPPTTDASGATDAQTALLELMSEQEAGLSTERASRSTASDSTQGLSPQEAAILEQNALSGVLLNRSI